MIAETIANYMFVNVASDVATGTSAEVKKQLLIRATQGFGLFVMIQGI
jgi:hypothetical protein